MGMIGSLSTVNGGTVVNTQAYSVEAMGPGYSNHRGYMVATYAAEGHIKVEVIYDGNRFYVYRFKGYVSNHHYWSTQYSKEYMLNSKKYKKMAETCIVAMADLFNM